MKQVMQHLRTGRIEVADIPCPLVRPGHLLIQSVNSLISAGTERMLVEFAKGSLIAKARSQPDKVKQVLDKIRSDGLMPTLETVFSRLDEPMPLGYCNVGRVLEVGAGVDGFAPGDRVVSNGRHAEVVCVPKHLCAKIPDEVSDEQAAFTVLSSIGLQGVRLLYPTLGEKFVVFGLGLIGLVTVQLLRAHGCDVLGVDVNPTRVKLAEKLGARTVLAGGGGNPILAASAWTDGRGVDGVLITAAAKTDEIMHQSAEMCRKRGRIVLVGVVGLNLRRPDFYEKELTFQVSCSYGPGRYDETYEQRGQDYPYGFVRWTEQRNFEAILATLRSGGLVVDELITHRFAHAEAPDAYDAILQGGEVLGVILKYPEQAPPTERVIRVRPVAAATSQPTRPVVAMIGAGMFSKGTLLPALKASGATIKTVASAGGMTGLHAARKFEAEQAGSDYREILNDPEVSAVFITTRHDSHPTIAAEALEAGKHVFVEKPLAVDEEGLERVRQAYIAHPELQLMVGFNRRFAPHAVKARELLANRSQPLAVEMMVNAGHIPPDHWILDPAAGGGRVIGEGCHFIDLLLAIVGHPITSVQAVMFGGGGALAEDKMTIVMTYADGSIGTVHYWANGPKSYPKERVEIFSEGRVLVMDNWRRLRAWNWDGVPKMSGRQDKGHKAEVAQFVDRVASGGPPVIPFEELELVTRATFAAMQSAREGVTIRLSREAEPAAAAPLEATHAS